MSILVRGRAHHEYIHAKMEHHNKAYNQLPDDTTHMFLEALSASEVLRLRTVLLFGLRVVVARVSPYTSSLLAVEDFTATTPADHDEKVAAVWPVTLFVVQRVVSGMASDGQYLMCKNSDEIHTWRACDDTSVGAHHMVFPDRAMGQTEKWDKSVCDREYLPSYSWFYPDRVPYTLPPQGHDNGDDDDDGPSSPTGDVYTNPSVVYTHGNDGVVTRT